MSTKATNYIENYSCPIKGDCILGFQKIKVFASNAGKVKELIRLTNCNKWTKDCINVCQKMQY